MKTVVFVDELLLVNFAAAAALLLGAGLLCGRSCTGLRLCAGSAAAAVSTLVLLAPPWPAPLAVLYKIASCCGVVAVCYGVAGVRSFARLCGWYAALNGLLCGAVVLPGVQANNLSVLLPVRPGRLLLCCAGVYALLQNTAGLVFPLQHNQIGNPRPFSGKRRRKACRPRADNQYVNLNWLNHPVDPPVSAFRSESCCRRPFW